jgi:hypothetical protein
MTITFANVSKPDDDAYVPPAVGRDRWGRPLIVPEGGGKPVPYTRISTLCKALDDSNGLTGWYGRMTALGVARRPDLQAQASVLTAEDDDKDELNQLVEEAMTAAGSTKARNLGNALHRLTHLADTTDADLTGIAPEMLADLDAYMQATADLEVVDAERFVVVDSVRAAGSYDRQMRCPDGKVKIADIKTGLKANQFPLPIAVQCGLYANGQHYDPDTGERLPMDDVDLESALLIHLPAGTGTCNIYNLDIRGAMSAAHVANTIRDWRKAKLLTPYKP